MKSIITFSAFVSLAACQAAPSQTPIEDNADKVPSIATLQAFTTCQTHACILPIIESTGRCFTLKEQRSWGMYHRHEDCRGDALMDDVVIGFGDASPELSASIATKNEAYANQLFAEAKRLGYAENEDDAEMSDETKRLWFETPSHPNSQLMWETYEDDDGATQWHIGIVWNATT